MAIFLTQLPLTKQIATCDDVIEYLPAFLKHLVLNHIYILCIWGMLEFSERTYL